MILKFVKITGYGLVLSLAACTDKQTVGLDNCTANLFVLGTAQDAGKPQIGQHTDPAWRNGALIRTASSLALLKSDSNKFYLFDATPDIKFQLYALAQYSGQSDAELAGVFLTHGHMGHYLGLAQLGREAMEANNIPVYAMPKMQNFLENNGPWDLLVKLGNIDIKPISDQMQVKFGDNIVVTPFAVPHRGEYTETVGFRIQGAGKSAIYLPDIDSWEQWDTREGGDEAGTRLEDIITANDYLFLDATFYSGDELPGRDMSKIPHPTITHTIERLQPLSPNARAKIHFTHLNHSNPAHDEITNAFQNIEKSGFNVSKAGQHFCLD
ncbi:MAG: pyrroloquinoline quinone biosynthesis protein PqqB [Robiginitomaculum sp.]|nr:MAG: pyrroloquinoline quinone biosynthesis protein PqqB [Robiginitomaculum sp.]